MARRVTLKDLALAAGVGVATVSRALAGASRCSPETREKIRQLAEQMGYVPDPALSALVSHRENARAGQSTFNLAIVTADQVDQTDRYRSAIWQSFRTAAGYLGYSVEQVDSTRQKSPESLGGMLRSRGVRGIVWGGFRREEFLADFPWQWFAHVGFVLPVVRPQIPSVRDDSFVTVREAVLACYERGYRRPGLALHVSTGSVLEKYQQGGWLQAHAELGITPAEIWRSPGSARGSLAEWVCRVQPDIVVGNVEEIHQTLHAEGVRVPGDTAYLNLLHPGDDFPGFDCREEQIGQVLLNVLDRQIRHNDLGLTENPHTILLQRRFLGWKS